MFIVRADNPAVAYQITEPQVTDSEGNLISGEDLSYEVTSTDSAVVAVEQDAENELRGLVSFGGPGLASINAVVKDSTGDILGSFGAQFTVTVGDPAAIVGGSIAFEGLEEAPEPEPQPES